MIPRGVTVILVQRDALVRADFGGGRVPRLRALHRPEAKVELSLVERVEFAARCADGLAARTLVLSDDVFQQTLELDARALRGLQTHEIANALAFEAQMYSGVTAADALIAWRARADNAPTRGFDVVEIGRAELQDMGARLLDLGSRLVALAHPAGVPRPVGFDFGDDSALGAWLAAWARELASPSYEILRIEPPRRPLTAARKATIAVAGCVLVAGLAWLDRARLVDQREDLGKQTIAALAPIDALARARAESATLEEELRTLRGTGIVGAKDMRLAWRPEIPAHVLRTLSTHRPRGVILDTITIGWKGGSVSGVAADLAGAERMNALLHEVLTPMGIDVRPQSRTLKQSGELAGTYAFDVKLLLTAVGSAGGGP